MKARIQLEQEEDGRWIAEIHGLPGVLAYGPTREAAVDRVKDLAARVVADRLEHGEPIPELDAPCSVYMTRWPVTEARRMLAALLRIGWQIQRQSGSHRVLTREGWPDETFAFDDDEKIGPDMIARIAQRTGLRPDDL